MLESSVVAPSRNYQQRMVRPFGVGGEADSSWRLGLSQSEERTSMRQAQERLGENLPTGMDTPPASGSLCVCMIIGHYRLPEDETAYIFDPECLPQQRQQFFQLCDLHADSLQALIHTNDGRETRCNVSGRV